MTDTEARGKREKSVCDIVTFPHWEAGETRGGNLCDTGTVRESIISSRYNRSFKQLYDAITAWPREFWRENRVRVHNVQVQDSEVDKHMPSRPRQTDSSDDSREAAVCCHFLCLPSKGKVSNVENHLNSN